MLGSLVGLPGLASAQEGGIASLLMKIGMLRNQVAPTGGYDGKTWGELTFLERVKVYDWTTEIYVLVTFAVLVVSYIVGRKYNERKVNQFYDAVLPVFKENFGYIGVSPRTKTVKDSDTRFTTYASGRLNIESLVARFRLIDRHNIMNYTMGMFVPSLASPDGRPDHVEITLTPTDPRAIEPGVFAVAHKESMAEAQRDNFYFGVTKAVDSDKLPSPSYIFFEEHSEQADLLFTPELKHALALPGAERVFKWVAVSDMPPKAPKKEADVSQPSKISLMLKFPSGAAQEEAVRQILDATLSFVDALVAKPAFRGSTAKRIKTNREAEISKIKKQEEQLKKEDLEAKRAEERREAAQRERNLSEKEQRKLNKKESDKQARRQKAKMMRRA